MAEQLPLMFYNHWIGTVTVVTSVTQPQKMIQAHRVAVLE